MSGWDGRPPGRKHGRYVIEYDGDQYVGTYEYDEWVFDEALFDDNDREASPHHLAAIGAVYVGPVLPKDAP